MKGCFSAGICNRSKSTTIAKDKHEFVFPIIKVDTLIIGMQLGVGRVKAVHNN